MSTTLEKPDPGPSSEKAKPPISLGDSIFAKIALAAACTILLALAGVFIFLMLEGGPGLNQDEKFYAPATNFLGYVGPLLLGTITAAIIALVIAVPLAWGIALVVSHYAPKAIAAPVGYVIDLLAAVPSVVFGLWGIQFLAPKMVPFYDWLHTYFGWIPLFGEPSASGRTMLTAGIVLAIMILPIITAISREVFAQTPRLHEEAALALGATRWETIRMAVFPYSRSGMISAVMLGLGRALGETMAVAMVLSPLPGLVTWNLIGTNSSPSIASNIASNYKESTPGTVAVLIASGLVLFLVTFLVNFVARWIVARSERNLTR